MAGHAGAFTAPRKEFSYSGGQISVSRSGPRLLLLIPLTLAFTLVPNNPAAFWYAAPEVVCGWLQSDEDQWRCDMEPVGR
jgi:hypothetical protein